MRGAPGSSGRGGRRELSVGSDDHGEGGLISRKLSTAVRGPTKRFYVPHSSVSRTQVMRGRDVYRPGGLRQELNSLVYTCV